MSTKYWLQVKFVKKLSYAFIFKEYPNNIQNVQAKYWLHFQSQELVNIGTK